MFDYVRCRYPLRHYQDAEFQTKDVARLVDPGDPVDGLLDQYVADRASAPISRQTCEVAVQQPLHCGTVQRLELEGLILRADFLRKPQPLLMARDADDRLVALASGRAT